MIIKQKSFPKVPQYFSVSVEKKKKKQEMRKPLNLATLTTNSPSIIALLPHPTLPLLNSAPIF